jgi:hypothetical protein
LSGAPPTSRGMEILLVLRTTNRKDRQLDLMPISICPYRFPPQM